VVEPLFIAPISPAAVVGESYRLTGGEAKHAVSVRRLELGESVAVSDGQERTIRGKVSALGKDWLELDIAEITQLQPPDLSICLVQALAKGDRDELAIQACTELGATHFIPWQAERSISIWRDQKLERGVTRWQSIVTEAAKQSLRPLTPKVLPAMDSGELAAALSEFDLVLVLDPMAELSITAKKISLPERGRVAVVVGPEGGISESELAAFESASFLRVRLGSGVLRTSTAGVAAISYLQARAGNWS
jgi:16S rRNA (uracil1498-N3)-methyltransferase